MPRGRPRKNPTTPENQNVTEDKLAENQLTQNQLAEVATKVKHKRPKRSEQLAPHTAPGEMSTMIAQAMHFASFGPVDSNDPAQVEQRISDYFSYCIQNDIRPSAEGIALSLNITRTELWRWRENAEGRNKPDGVRNAIKKAYSILNYLLTQLMQDGHINPLSGMFLLRNNYHYSDKTEIVIATNGAMDNQNPEEVRDKYIKSLPEDTE